MTVGMDVKTGTFVGKMLAGQPHKKAASPNVVKGRRMSAKGEESPRVPAIRRLSLGDLLAAAAPGVVVDILGRNGHAISKGSEWKSLIPKYGVTAGEVVQCLQNSGDRGDEMLRSWVGDFTVGHWCGRQGVLEVHLPKDYFWYYDLLTLLVREFLPDIGLRDLLMYFSGTQRTTIDMYFYALGSKRPVREQYVEGTVAKFEQEHSEYLDRPIKSCGYKNGVLYAEVELHEAEDED